MSLCEKCIEELQKNKKYAGSCYEICNNCSLQDVNDYLETQRNISMTEWKDPKLEEPNLGYGKNRYLVKIKCDSGIHTCLAWQYAIKCCGVNIAYYEGYDRWIWATDKPFSDHHKVEKYMEIPK